MYAVLSSGGKQYRVEAGTTLMLERLDGGPGEPGAQVTFDRVLLIGDGEDVTIGTPTVAGTPEISTRGPFWLRAATTLLVVPTARR